MQEKMQRLLELLEIQGEMILKQVLMEEVSSEQQILDELWSEFLRCDETLCE